MGATKVRRPAMDLYEPRLCLALTCLSMLIFGWSTMVENGRSFSASLRANQFGGNQVKVLDPWLRLKLLGPGVDFRAVPTESCKEQWFATRFFS